MRWIRNIFAVIAIGCLALWLSFYFFVYGAYIPIKNNSGLTFSLYTNYMTFGIEHGGTPNRPGDKWVCDIQTRNELRERAINFNNVCETLGFEPKLPAPTEILTYGYDTFNFSDHARKWTWYGSNFTLPTWLPILLFGLWPAIASARHIKRRYFTQHICRKCGYDLRATPSGICPECGHEQTVTKTV